MIRGRGALLLAALVALAPAMAGCRRVPDAAAETDDAIRVEGDRITLPADSARLAAFAARPADTAPAPDLQLNGRLAWDEDATVRVFSPYAGRVIRVVADAGAHVRAGDTLALIASPDFAQAQADARRAATDLALAERTAARTRDLFAHGVVAEKDVDGADADVARARAEALRASARLTLYGSDSAATDPVFVLRAPLGGTVVERSITPGQEVRPDQMLASAPALFAPLFVISDPAHLWVMVDVPERDVAAMHPGARLRLEVAAYPGQSFAGTVSLVGGAVDSTTRTVKVRGVVENPRRQLMAEMLVSVVTPSALTHALTVPAAAAVLAGDRHVVFVQEGPGRFVRTPVAVTAAPDGSLEVRSGLAAGQQVVVDGAMLLEQIYQQHRRS